MIHQPNKDNTTTPPKGNNANTVLANVIYPQLEDIRIACQMIANGIYDLTPMLSKEETVQFQQLATKWMYGLREHKKEVIDGMISELSL